MSQGPTLGVIADDFTGATDVAGMLVQGGWRTLQTIGVPEGGLADADAVVVALKSRTVPAAEAVRESLAALQALQAAGARRFYFKVCSTFDSTPAGNIGPVAEALMDALDTDLALVCPAFPENGRTVYRGHLFVGDQLLSESGMRTHPLTPMTDANLVRVLQAQSRRRVGLLGHAVVAQGPHAAREAIAALRAAGTGLFIADALADADLRTLAEAVAEAPLVVAGSGLALGMTPPDGAGGRSIDTPEGPAAVLAGSCSEATNRQVAAWIAAGHPALALDPIALTGGEAGARQALGWALERVAQGPVLIYATAPAAQVKAVQAALGAARAGELVEQALAEVALGLVERGVRRLVVAGGETSGAVVKALGIKSLSIGAPICPGVPWTQATGRPLWLALKSGNFGRPDFFRQALWG